MTNWIPFRMRAVLLALVPTFVLACAPAGIPGLTLSPSAAIAPRLNAWVGAYEARDATALADLYTADGLYAANTVELLRGRAGIRQGVEAWFTRHPQMLASLGFSSEARMDLSVEELRFRTAGDLAYSVARFVIRVVPAGCVLDAGHALIAWRRDVDGEWRIDSQVVNQDRTPPPGACARPSR